MSFGDHGRSVQDMSPEEEGMLPPQGAPGQADGAGRRVRLLCPFRDHSSSTSIKGLFSTFFFCGGGSVSWKL